MNYLVVFLVFFSSLQGFASMKGISGEVFLTEEPSNPVHANPAIVPTTVEADVELEIVEVTAPPPSIATVSATVDAAKACEEQAVVVVSAPPQPPALAALASRGAASGPVLITIETLETKVMALSTPKDWVAFAAELEAGQIRIPETERTFQLKGLVGLAAQQLVGTTGISMSRPEAASAIRAIRALCAMAGSKDVATLFERDALVSVIKGPDGSDHGLGLLRSFPNGFQSDLFRLIVQTILPKTLEKLPAAPALEGKPSLRTTTYMSLISWISKTEYPDFHITMLEQIIAKEGVAALLPILEIDVTSPDTIRPTKERTLWVKDQILAILSTDTHRTVDTQKFLYNLAYSKHPAIEPVYKKLAWDKYKQLPKEKVLKAEALVAQEIKNIERARTYLDSIALLKLQGQHILLDEVLRDLPGVTAEQVVKAVQPPLKVETVNGKKIIKNPRRLFGSALHP